MDKKFRRSLFFVFVNTGLFWVFMDCLPDATFRLGSIGKLIAGFGFTLALGFGDFLIFFFKLPKIWITYLIARALTAFAYLWALDNYMPAILDLGPTYLGGLDLILFKIPKFLMLPNIYMTLAFSAIFLVICSIILEKLKK